MRFIDCRRHIVLVAVAALTAVAVQAADFDAVTVFRNGDDGYNAFRIPALIKAANGDLLAFCEARMGGDASQIDLVSKRSTDNGKTWQPLRIVQDHKDFHVLFAADPPPITVGNPAPVVDLLDPDHAGRIWLPFTVENDRVFVTYSDDHGKSWAARREITPEVKKEGWGWYATGPVHSIQLQHGNHRGRLVVPCDHRLGISGNDDGPLGAHAMLSDDHGLSWRLGAIDDTYDDDVNANETSVVELVDGRLYFNTRDHVGKAPGTRAGAYSSDGGQTFDRAKDSRYKWFVPESEPLDPPVVQCAMLRAASAADGQGQNLILFSGPDENGPSGKGRSDLRLRYSTDETASWNDGPLIHEGPAAYSDLVRLGSGQFGVLFEAGATGTKRYDEIRFVPFDTNDLNIDGEPHVGKQNAADEILLIVRSDDMGMAHAVNQACVKTVTDGIARSVEVIVPAPWFMEAAALLSKHPEIDTGVHLDLTSEWSMVKWGPVSQNAASLVDANGHFYPMTHQRQGWPPGTGFVESTWQIEQVERELRAQIELALRHLPNVTHLSAHMGTATSTPELEALVEHLAQEYSLPLDPPGLKRARWSGDQTMTPEEKENSLIRMLEGLQPGLWMFVEHPGENTPEMQAIGHPGYENVAADRAGVTYAFTSEKVKQTVKRRGIRLVSYSDVLAMRGN